MRRARAAGLGSLPSLTPLNERAWIFFQRLFSPLTRDFPALLTPILEAMEIPVRNRAEQVYILRAWTLIYEHLLRASRLEAASRSSTPEQTNDA